LIVDDKHLFARQFLGQLQPRQSSLFRSRRTSLFADVAAAYRRYREWRKEMTDTKRIDWERIANDLSAIQQGALGGGPELGGRALALAAIEQLVGPDQLAAAVDYYVSGRPGSELARAVLWTLHPWSAMQRCRELFAFSNVLSQRRSAVELLRVVADGRALPWVSEFLADPDPEIQIWGVGIIDQLLCSALVDLEACERLLAAAMRHHNPAVREAAVAIGQQARGREAT
jgi:hypothetical protein